MRVLVGCECSGRVRDAFLRRGHDAVSCDLEPSEVPGPHIQDDVRNHLDEGWDMGIFFPPCTHLCVSGARWFKRKRSSVDDAVQFVLTLMDAPIRRWAIENPVGILSSRIRRPDQIIQPYEFGDPAKKTTCLWMKGLPGLFPTNVVKPKYVQSASGRIWSEWFLRTSSLPIKIRSRERSRTFPGIAEAMAEQWGILGESRAA